MMAWSKSLLWPNWLACRVILELLLHTQTALLCSLSLVTSALSVGHNMQNHNQSSLHLTLYIETNTGQVCPSVLKRLCLKCSSMSNTYELSRVVQRSSRPVYRNSGRDMRNGSEVNTRTESDRL